MDEREMKESLTRLDGKLEGFDTRLRKIETNVENMDQKIENSFNRVFSAMSIILSAEERIVRTEERLNTVETKFTNEIDEIKTSLKDVSKNQVIMAEDVGENKTILRHAVKLGWTVVAALIGVIVSGLYGGMQ